MSQTKIFLLILLSSFCFQLGSLNQDGTCGELNLSGKNVRFPWVAELQGGSREHSDVIKYAAVILSPYLVAMNANNFKTDGKMEFMALEDYRVSANMSHIDDSHKNNSNVQTVKVSQIRIHPGYNMKSWFRVKNDFALITLQTPLVFDSNIHPVCIPTPDLFNTILSRSTNSSFKNETFVMISGWNKYYPENIFLKLTVNSERVCKNLWNIFWPNEVYGNRYCVNVSLGNVHQNCIHRDNGVVAQFNDKFYFMGLVNNLFTNVGRCNSRAYEYIAEPTDSIVNFIADHIRCGPNNFACTSGMCIPLNFSCNGKLECDDGSDENGIYCLSKFQKDEKQRKYVPADDPHLLLSDTPNSSNNSESPTFPAIIFSVTVLIIIVAIVVQVYRILALQKTPTYYN